MSRIVDEPAVPSGAPAESPAVHSHPLPTWLRIGAVIYGLLLAVTFTAAVVGASLLFTGAEERNDRQVQRAVAGVLAELDRRSAQRDAEAVKQDKDAAETRRLVDDLRLEVQGLRGLAEAAGLDTSTVPATTPRRTPSPSPAASPAPRPPASAPPRPPAATQRPSPTPAGGVAAELCRRLPQLPVCTLTPARSKS